MQCLDLAVHPWLSIGKYLYVKSTVRFPIQNLMYSQVLMFKDIPFSVLERVEFCFLSKVRMYAGVISIERW